MGLWIIRNQFGRRNISNYMRGHLANETAKRLKVRPVGKPKRNGADILPTSGELPKGTVRTKAAAKQHGTSHDTMHKVAVSSK